jgi:hypothetical protein
MSEKPPSKDEALEALDFIVNVLKEHEKDLDKLVCELGSVAGQLGESGEINDKVRKIEDKINSLQNEVGTLVKSLAAPPKEPVQHATAQALVVQTKPAPRPETPVPAPTLANGLPLFLRCRQWEDFQAFSAHAQTVSFVLKETDKTLEVNALKNNQLINYQGEPPTMSTLLKLYLSRQLDVAEKLVLEGEITLK